MVSIGRTFPTVPRVGKRVVGALVAGIFVVGACSGGSKNAEQPVATPGSTAVARTSTTVPRSTTTTSTPEYSFDDSVPPPKLINTGNNYVAILKSFDQYGRWLVAHHPDPSLVSRIVATGTKQHRLFALDLVRLRDNGMRLIETLGANKGTYTILSATADAFSARVVQDVRTHRTVDAAGRVTSHTDFSGATTYLMLAVLIHSRWYFAAVDEQDPAHVRL
jgi:hypothetical protein